MFPILGCNRIVDSVYFYFLNLIFLYASPLSSILSLFLLESLVKLLLRDERFSILNQFLLFHQLFRFHKYSCGLEPIADGFAYNYFFTIMFLFPFVFDWCGINQF